MSKSTKRFKVTLYKLLLNETTHLVFTADEFRGMVHWVEARGRGNDTKLSTNGALMDRLLWFSTDLGNGEVAIPHRHYTRFREQVEVSAGGPDRVQGADKELLDSLDRGRRFRSGTEIFQHRLASVLVQGGGADE